MERKTWDDEESSSSWDDAEFESVLDEERDEGADVSKAEDGSVDGSEQESFAGDGDQTSSSDSALNACEESLEDEQKLPVLRRRKIIAWQADYQVHPPTGEQDPPISPLGQESGVWRSGSLDIGSTLALALEEDAREKAKQQEERVAGFGKESGGGVVRDEDQEILERFSATGVNEIEVEVSESQERGSLASFSFQGCPEPGVESEVSSTHARIVPLWPAGTESDEEEVAPVRKRRLHLEVEVDRPPGIKADEEEVASEQKRARPEREAPQATDWTSREEISEFPGRFFREGYGENESIGSSEICLTKEVYKMPVADYVPPESGDTQGQLLLWPAALIIQAIGFQVRLIGKAFSVFLWILNMVCFVFWTPVAKTLEAKDLATGTISQGVSYVSQIPSGIRERASNARPKVGKLWKKMGMGCLAATYVMVMLISLLVPAIVLDYVVMSRFVEEPIEVREVLHFDYTQPKPSAVVNLLPPTVLLRARTYAAAHPDKIVKVRAIPVSHKFDVTVILTVPESEYNRKLGMFQISVELLSVRAHVLARSSRPCMLQFRSNPIRYAKTLVLGLPLLMGLSQEYQSLSVRVLENQEERVVPTATVKTYLEPKAGFPEGHGLPELYSAQIHIKSKLPWIKALMYTWRWTFYVWSAFWLFMFEVAVILLCCRQALVPTSWRSWTGDSSEVRDGGYRSPRGRKPSSFGEKRTTSKVKRRVSFQDDIPTADVVPSSRARAGTPPVGPSSSEDVDLSATSSLPLPQLEETLEETLDFVQLGAQGVEKAVRNVGGAAVETVAVGVEKVILKFSDALGSKPEPEPSF